MCDSNPIEECFKSLIEKEILSIEDSTSPDEITAVIFPPFSAKLRFLLHNSLQNHPALQTVSVGVQPDRHPIVFKSNKRVNNITDVPEGKIFIDQIEEFRFRTNLSDDCSLVKPTNDFSIFVNSIDKLDASFPVEFPFVTVSSNTKYIDIRRALRVYYRKGLVNCYEVRNSDDKSDHIIISNSKETNHELLKTYKEELNLIDNICEVKESVANVLQVMAKCGMLQPATPRVMVDRSAAANIMSRHLGIVKKPRTKSSD